MLNGLPRPSRADTNVTPAPFPGGCIGFPSFAFVSLKPILTVINYRHRARRQTTVSYLLLNDLVKAYSTGRNGCPGTRMWPFQHLVSPASVVVSSVMRNFRLLHIPIPLWRRDYVFCFPDGLAWFCRSVRSGRPVPISWSRFSSQTIWGDDGGSCGGADYVANALPNRAGETYGLPHLATDAYPKRKRGYVHELWIIPMTIVSICSPRVR